MGEKILVVDDQEGIRKVLNILLSDIGYHVFTAENTEEGLRIFRDVNPPIVLTDIKMPGRDGIEFLCEIKQVSPETEVIMITGHGDMELAIKSLKYDATDFINKPIRNDVLEIALKRAHAKCPGKVSQTGRGRTTDRGRAGCGRAVVCNARYFG